MLQKKVSEDLRKVSMSKKVIYGTPQILDLLGCRGVKPSLGVTLGSFLGSLPFPFVRFISFPFRSIYFLSLSFDLFPSPFVRFISPPHSMPHTAISQSHWRLSIAQSQCYTFLNLSQSPAVSIFTSASSISPALSIFAGCSLGILHCTLGIGTPWDPKADVLAHARELY